LARRGDGNSDEACPEWAWAEASVAGLDQTFHDHGEHAGLNAFPEDKAVGAREFPDMIDEPE